MRRGRRGGIGIDPRGGGRGVGAATVGRVSAPAPPIPPATAPAVPPTIGVDPGQTWTAAVLRVGDTAVHGWTMGPVDQAGTVRRDALNEVDAWDAFVRYAARLVAGLDELADYATTRWGEV